jgi:predicted PurR-regulated permease PerM
MDGAIALGVFTGLMIIIPYIGIALGLGIGILSAILQFGFGAELIWVLAIFGIGQVLEGFFLTPRLVGERIGLHPVAVLFALMVFGQLFGFFGILLALPMAAISLVAIRYSKARYLDSAWFKEK